MPCPCCCDVVYVMHASHAMVHGEWSCWICRKQRSSWFKTQKLRPMGDIYYSQSVGKFAKTPRLQCLAHPHHTPHTTTKSNNNTIASTPPPPPISTYIHELVQYVEFGSICWIRIDIECWIRINMLNSDQYVEFGSILLRAFHHFIPLRSERVSN